LEQEAAKSNPTGHDSKQVEIVGHILNPHAVKAQKGSGDKALHILDLVK